MVTNIQVTIPHQCHSEGTSTTLLISIDKHVVKDEFILFILLIKYKIWLWISLAIAIDFAQVSFPDTMPKTTVSQYWWTSVSTDHKPSFSWYVNCFYTDILTRTLCLHTETDCRSFLSIWLFYSLSGTISVHINWFCYYFL